MQIEKTIDGLIYWREKTSQIVNTAYSFFEYMKRNGIDIETNGWISSISFLGKSFNDLERIREILKNVKPSLLVGDREEAYTDRLSGIERWKEIGAKLTYGTNIPEVDIHIYLEDEKLIPASIRGTCGFEKKIVDRGQVEQESWVCKDKENL